jgi:DNA helicase-2/ATP-dependent DNA helicase PcrA
VQILTVHAAKGLEWRIVAVPHLTARVFPSTASQRTWLSDPADLPPLLRGDRAEVSEHGVPVLDLSDVYDRKMLADKINDHKAQLDQRRTDEERRLLYVALTRAEDTLLISGHHWGATATKPAGPSAFLLEIKDIIEKSAADGDACGVIERWAPQPADNAANPLQDEVVESVWPLDPVGERRSDVDRGAALVASVIHPGTEVTDTATTDTEAAEDSYGWAADVDALLAERERAQQRPPAELPPQLSVSTLVDLGRDRAGALQRIGRRLPTRPDPHALLGTAFHDWVQRYYSAERLFDLDDLPGAVDAELGQAVAEDLAVLQQSFAVSPWAARTPTDVEVPFDMIIDGRVIRGRIDAVFADDDGGFTVLDWKTGELPATPEALRHNAIQLAVYRLAWARMQATPPERVRAAFHYVRSGQTLAPEDLPGIDELAQLISDR